MSNNSNIFKQPRKTRKSKIEEKQEQVEAMQEKPFIPVRCNVCGEYILTKDDCVQNESILAEYPTANYHKKCYDTVLVKGSYFPDKYPCKVCGFTISTSFIKDFKCPQCNRFICATCKEPIGFQHSVFIDGKFYHPSCLVQCNVCGKYLPIEQAKIKNEKVFCKDCNMEK